MNRLKQDLIYGLRHLWARKLFSSMVIATLALGIGLNAAVFSAVDATLLRPLPGVERSDDLVQLYRTFPGEKFGSLSVPDVFDFRDRTGEVFEGLAAWTFATVNVTSGGEPRVISGQAVSANYFDVLGVRPALGRFFRPEEDSGPLAHPVVVLSDGVWKQWFGADPGVIGQSVIMNGRSMEIVGVAPFVAASTTSPAGAATTAAENSSTKRRTPKSPRRLSSSGSTSPTMRGRRGSRVTTTSGTREFAEKPGETE